MVDTSPQVTNDVAKVPAQGGDNPFKQTLTVFDMVVYGLIMMVPIAPMGIYGGVFQASGGMPALAYAIGFIAVLFSVLSFAIMIRIFPSSGSIYTYVTHIMGTGVGFIAGWLMLLQYLVSPTLMYIIAGTALNGFVPQIPVWAWCLMFLALVSVVSLRGMQTTMMVNRIALAAELVILAVFVGMGIFYVASHPSTSSFSATALFNPQTFDFANMMSAVSLSVLSYVGFGVIATLTQQAKDEREGPPRAMMIMALILVVLFAGQCFIATCIDPSGTSFANDPNNGFYVVAQMAGGPLLALVCAVAVALSQGIFTALVTQTSVSVILFSMARGGSLPKIIAKLNPKTNVATNAMIFVIGLSVVLIFVMQPLGIDSVAKVANFGALATYTLLNLCVIVFCWFQRKQRKQPLRHLIFPLIGALVCFSILISLDAVAHIVGVIWIVIGIIYYCVVKYALHREITMG